MIKIAIVEDDQSISQMYRMKFEADGFDVGLADDGVSGVKLVKAMNPDIILMDLQMPNMRGDEALLEIRSYDWGKNIPAIILTNLGKEESPDNLDKLKVDSYIVKAEMTPRQVVVEVKKVLEKYKKS